MVGDAHGTTSPPRSSLLTANGQAAAAHADQWKAKRFAVKFHPPCIFLEYEDTAQKRRVRQVKLTRVPADVDVDRLTRKVIRSFPRQLDPVSVKYEQVRKLVVKLLDSMLQTGVGEAHDGATPGSKTTFNSSKALKLEPPTPGSGSANTPRLMPCLSPSIPPTPADGQAGGDGSWGSRQTTRPVGVGHSVESNDRFSTSTFGGYTRESKEDLGLDDLDDALSELDRELGGAATTSGNGIAAGSGLSRNNSSSTLHHQGSATSLVSLDCSAPRSISSQPSTSQFKPPGSFDKTRFAQEADRLVLEVEIEGDVDLNKVTDMELKMAKQRMEEDFLKHQLRPGDPGYEYDKQVEFAPATEANDWDDSSDEAEGTRESPAAAASGPADSSSKTGSGLRIQVRADDDEDEHVANAGGYSSPESVPDDVSPNRVAIDTDSDLGDDLH